jgi:uncharacterized membrane protein
VADTVRNSRWFSPAGLPVMIGAGIPLAVAGGLMLWIGVHHFQSFAPRWNDVLLIAFGICALVSAAIVAIGLSRGPLWRRRSPAAQQEAERWEAFRRYLTDFPRLDLAPPSSLQLWERLLVYGIAFGIADRVLEGAHLHMPEELHNASSIYWISPNGDLGSAPPPSASGI